MSHGQRMDALRRAFSCPPWMLGGLTEEALLSLDAALTHDSYSNEASARGKAEMDNERLEFLGDAALELAVREFICRETSMREGGMTGLKQLLVSNDVLADLFRRRLDGLLPLLRVGGGQALSNGILAGSLEALIGAIYTHAGMPGVSRVCDALLFQDPSMRERIEGYMGRAESL